MHLLVSYFPVSTANNIPLKEDYFQIFPNEIASKIVEYLPPSLYTKASRISYQFYLIIKPLKESFYEKIEKIAESIFGYIQENPYKLSYCSFLSTNLRIQVFPVIEQRFFVAISAKLDWQIKKELVKTCNYKPINQMTSDSLSFCIIEKIKIYRGCCLITHCLESRQYFYSFQGTNYAKWQIYQKLKKKLERE